MKNTERNSDIDFFVVIERGRIWTGRFLATVLIHLLGKRRYDGKVKDRICLNYFIAADNLEIKLKDVFAANEYSFFLPLFGEETYSKFGKDNAWIKRIKPNFEFSEVKSPKYAGHSRVSALVQKWLEYLINTFRGSILEFWLRRMQIRKIEKNPLTHKRGAYVEYDDKNLIFLPEPQGEKIFIEYLKRLKVLT